MLDVLRYRSVSFLFSLLLSGAFVGTYVYKVKTYGYAFNYSVDFTGGTQIRLKFAQPASIVQLRSILEAQGWASPVIRELSGNEAVVRVKDVDTGSVGLGSQMQKVISREMADNQVTVLQTESVGAGVGDMLRSKALWGIGIALLLMLAYIALRFRSWGFALGAVIALFHDALVMVAAFLLLNLEISTSVIAAILAVIGYSINDTIVIFSRIRENLKMMSGVSLETVVNTSINQTLRRTLLTSISTALSVGPMLILGGDALRDSSLALLIGVVFGTYSSIFIASPVMMVFHKRTH